MTFNEFCSLNGVEDPDIMAYIDQARFPEGEFSPEFILVLYSQNGISPITIDGKEVEVRRKSISVWRPGQIIKFHPSESLKYKTLSISGNLQEHLNVGSTFLTMFVTEEYPVIRITSAYNETMHLFFDAMESVCGFQSNPYKIDCMLSILRALFYSTGYYMFRSLKIQDGNLAKFAHERPIYEDDTVSRFIKLVEKHSVRTRHLAFYAKEMEYNPKYLSALIKRATGHSGQKIIDQYSALTAMAKLAYGHQSVKEISDEMNFQSQSDFGKFFKRLTGTSPLSYRKRRFSREANSTFASVSPHSLRNKEK